jgi:hypothetical protein
VIEQLPLFSRLPGAIPATMLFGWLAWVLPIAPLFAVPVLRTSASRGTGLLLLVWGAALGGLTLTQNRYACDASPVAAVLFALGIANGTAAIARKLRLSARVERVAVAIACALLLVPSITQFHGPRALATLRWAVREQGRGDRSLATVHGTALRFAHEVRRATPETAGFQGEGGSPPEYGVLCEPSLGYVVQYAARRPTPASNAGPYVGAENVAAVQRLLAIGTEPEVVAIAEHLHARYVMTAARPNYGPRTTLFRLHALDGAGRGDAPRWERFRLVTEGPAGGAPFAALLGGAPPSWGHVPYKLFEVVAGAVLEVPAQAGQRVVARAAIKTPTERTFVYVAEAIADDDGRARIRVPYATETDAPARPIGPWRITSGDVVYHATLRDSDVVTGATVVIDPTSAER